MKILLAVDGSAESLAAAEVIASRPWPPDSQVRILSVIKLSFTPTEETRALPDSDYSRLEREAREQAQEAIDAALVRLKATNETRTSPLILSNEMLVGQPQEIILDEADRWEADLILLGSRGLGGFKRFLLGSVSSAVATHANRSVEIVRVDDTHPISKAALKILLAVDGSKGSATAVDAILERPWPADTTVKIISAAEPPQLPAEPWGMPGNYFAEWEKTIANTAHAAVKQAADRLADTSLTVAPVVLKGQARAVILTEAENWGADLIVLGTRGMGGFKRLLLGSVSSAVISHAPCSVLLARRRGDADDQ
jgi:nucleotide-binding universal stress UspA family protein